MGGPGGALGGPAGRFLCGSSGLPPPGPPKPPPGRTKLPPGPPKLKKTRPFKTETPSNSKFRSLFGVISCATGSDSSPAAVFTAP